MAESRRKKSKPRFGFSSAFSGWKIRTRTLTQAHMQLKNPIGILRQISCLVPLPDLEMRLYNFRTYFDACPASCYSAPYSSPFAGRPHTPATHGHMLQRTLSELDFRAAVPGWQREWELRSCGRSPRRSRNENQTKRTQKIRSRSWKTKITT